jgi:hypothetical protein
VPSSVTLATLVGTAVDGVFLDVVDADGGCSVLLRGGSGGGTEAAPAVLLDGSGLDLRVTTRLGEALLESGDASTSYNLYVVNDVPYLATAAATYVVDTLYEVAGAVPHPQAAREVAWGGVVATLLLLVAVALLWPPPPLRPAGVP